MKIDMKMVMAAALLLCLASSRMETVVMADSADCLDACSTGCVNTNTRLMMRCERKCQIKCGPAGAKVLGGNLG